jgi:hypothetical protein
MASLHWFFFDAAEAAHVDAALRTVADADADDAWDLRATLARLERAASLVRDTPSVAAPWRARGGRNFSGESLVELLCRVPDYDLDLNIPTKAILGQTYLITKINFFKAVRYALASLDAPDELTTGLSNDLARAVYSKLAEELFVSIVTDPTTPDDVKRNAARHLAGIWDRRLDVAMDSLARLLESVWQARSKLSPIMGTMLGMSEVFQLLRAACNLQFLDYFGGDDVPEEQLLAFEEFLFGLSFEEISRLRQHMQEDAKDVVTLDSVRDLLGRTPLSMQPTMDDAQALYTSYKKRRVKAHYRALTGVEGPKRTAEEYMMIALLHSGATP